MVLIHKLSIQTGRNAIDLVEGAHHTAAITLLHAHLKGTKERLYHVLLVYLIESMSFFQREVSLKEAGETMTVAKLITPCAKSLKCVAYPAFETPCRASTHQVCFTELRQRHSPDEVVDAHFVGQ